MPLRKVKPTKRYRYGMKIPSRSNRKVFENKLMKRDWIRKDAKERAHHYARWADARLTAQLLKMGFRPIVFTPSEPMELSGVQPMMEHIPDLPIWRSNYTIDVT